MTSFITSPFTRTSPPSGGMSIMNPAGSATTSFSSPSGFQPTAAAAQNPAAESVKVLSPRVEIAMGSGAVSPCTAVTLSFRIDAVPEFTVTMHDLVSSNEVVGTDFADVFLEASLNQQQLFSVNRRDADAMLRLTDGIGGELDVGGFLVNPHLMKGYVSVGATKSFVGLPAKISPLRYDIYRLPSDHNPDGKAPDGAGYLAPFADPSDLPSLAAIWLSYLHNAATRSGESQNRPRVVAWRDTINQKLAKDSTRIDLLSLLALDANNTWDAKPDETPQPGPVSEQSNSPLGALLAILEASANSQRDRMGYYHTITSDTQKRLFATAAAEFIHAVMLTPTPDFFATFVSTCAEFGAEYIPPQTLADNLGMIQDAALGIVETPISMKVDIQRYVVTPGTKALMPTRQVKVMGGLSGVHLGRARTQALQLAAVYPQETLANSNVLAVGLPAWMPGDLALGGTAAAPLRNPTSFERMLLTANTRADTKVRVHEQASADLNDVLRNWARQLYLKNALRESVAQLVVPLALGSKGVPVWRVGARYEIVDKDNATLFTGQLYELRHNIEIGQNGSGGTASTTLIFRHVEAARFKLPYRDTDRSPPEEITP